MSGTLSTRTVFFLELFASEAITVKLLFVTSVTSPIMKDVANNMVH